MPLPCCCLLKPTRLVGAILCQTGAPVMSWLMGFTRQDVTLRQGEVPDMMGISSGAGGIAYRVPITDH